jgi:hypothetical protein
MNVRQLVEELSRYDPDTPVLLSSDQEGNSYHVARVIDRMNIEYVDPIPYRIETVYETELTDDMKKLRYTEQDLGWEWDEDNEEWIKPNMRPVVVLWP